MAADRPLVPGALPFELYPPGTLALNEVDLSAKVDEESYEKRVVKLQERAYALQVRNFLDAARNGGRLRGLGRRRARAAPSSGSPP